MTILLLVRHATNDMVGKRLAGWSPGVHLNAEGQQEARELAARLADLPIQIVYSSPLERAIETAQAVAEVHRAEVRIRSDLGEVRYGEWEGLSLGDLAKDDLWPGVQIYPSGTRFPGGESLREVQSRVVSALEEIASRHPEDGDIAVVVSHGDAIRTALAHFMGIHLDLFQRLIISPASVSVITLGKTGPRILRVNDSGPLRFPRHDEESGAGGNHHMGS